jgi:hypothetical protein
MLRGASLGSPTGSDGRRSTRRALFETIDKPALKPLLLDPYEYAEWKKARVNVDYPIEMGGHYYSVPYQLVKEQVDVRLTSTTLIQAYPRVRKSMTGNRFNTDNESLYQGAGYHKF